MEALQTAAGAAAETALVRQQQQQLQGWGGWSGGAGGEGDVGAIGGITRSGGGGRRGLDVGALRTELEESDKDLQQVRMNR